MRAAATLARGWQLLAKVLGSEEGRAKMRRMLDLLSGEVEGSGGLKGARKNSELAAVRFLGRRGRRWRGACRRAVAVIKLRTVARARAMREGGTVFVGDRFLCRIKPRPAPRAHGAGPGVGSHGTLG